MVSRRDVCVAVVASVVTMLAGAGLRGAAPVMGSTIFDWNSLTEQPNKTGTVRKVVQAPTATLDELEIHITTLNKGETPHPPHQHPDEELVIIKEGTVEALVGGEWKKAGPGSVIFNASNELHALRNVGTTPATYHVINWRSPGTQKAQPTD